ncbi:predicted protein [Botrytis cinerea T4]|uniref:Uncharacterized protein n=1 Tax=Botryotinia fuckeliana (strain T4) TaxID=999810 RepID=G2XN69_BOTF4|nr:predicted protein [Botrytis cinerea T4]
MFSSLVGCANRGASTVIFLRRISVSVQTNVNEYLEKTKNETIERSYKINTGIKRRIVHEFKVRSQFKNCRGPKWASSMASGEGVVEL